MASPRIVDVLATLKTLATPLLWMLLATVSGMGLLWHGWQHKQAAESSRAAALQALQQSRSELESRLQQQQDIAEFSAPYLALTAQEFLAPERRFDWGDALENLRKRKLVPQLSYRILAPANFADASLAGMQAGYSEMKLQLGLKQEEQLLDFFDALHAEKAGWFQLDSCTLKRNAAQDEDILLLAECNGRWITLGREDSP